MSTSYVVQYSSLDDSIVFTCTGIYPIAQLREPYSSVPFLAERFDLPALLALEPPDDYVVSAAAFHWSAYAICEGNRSLSVFFFTILEQQMGINVLIFLFISQNGNEM